jgi:hypothetical protein
MLLHEEQSGRLLRRPKQDYPAPTVAEFCTAVLTYGKLNKDDWVDAPGFIILSGEVKDRFGGIGMYVKGPLGNPEDNTERDKLRLQVVITADTFLQCARREDPAT